MLRKSLKETILEQVNQYLSVDNPVRETMGSKIAGFFSKSGSDGRILANKFRDEFLLDVEYELPGDENTVPGDIKLQLDLWEILKDEPKNPKFNLGNSTIFRNRLLAGMCEHFGLGEEAILNRQYAIRNTMLSPHAGAPNVEILRGQAMKDLLTGKLESRRLEMLERPARK